MGILGKGLKAGDKIKIINKMYIDCTIMDWKNGDVLEIKEVEEDYKRILVYDNDKVNSEYIYEYEFTGLELCH